MSYIQIIYSLSQLLNAELGLDRARHQNCPDRNDNIWLPDKIRGSSYSDFRRKLAGQAPGSPVSGYSVQPNFLMQNSQRS